MFSLRILLIFGVLFLMASTSVSVAIVAAVIAMSIMYSLLILVDGCSGSFVLFGVFVGGAIVGRM